MRIFTGKDRLKRGAILSLSLSLSLSIELERRQGGIFFKLTSG
jgi:hypothetical protein